ncbi:MAG: class I poly(R)-hydroxyalkanoic acid synthase [Parvibaculaceae bacterium]|nr:class I poly(R)-hydroxyalkanoic acid synthase [Parvibaculaceae bacterium]
MSRSNHTDNASSDPSGDASSAMPSDLSQNVLKAATEALELLAEQSRSASSGEKSPFSLTALMGPASEALSDLLKHYANQSEKWNKEQSLLSNELSKVGKNFLEKLLGMPATDVIDDNDRDRRFKDPLWTESPVFDTIRQGYLVISRWILRLAEEANGLEPHQYNLARFYAKQVTDALSPSNFLLTNPEAIRTTIENNGTNLLSGLKNLKNDLNREGGILNVTQSDTTAFSVGGNIAVTPGKVIYQNDIIQLIQYSPMTEEVHAVPLLIIPPWINKFYILDLTQERSFVKWCLEKGYTVFMVSWVNPDETLAEKTFADYMDEGILAALDAVQRQTGAAQVNTIGYCIGGTLLSATLGYMAAHKDKRVKSATFFAAQSDFTEAGDLRVFIDERQVNTLEQQMKSQKGILGAASMVQVFNLLRSNDLIWNYVVRNYLLGQDPAPFDLLYWNADATRMPEKLHLYYLRECYVKNALSLGNMVLNDTEIDLSKVKTPVYIQSSRNDHIAPYQSIYRSTHLYGGPVRFIMAGSGHIAGVINPPAAQKYQHWLNKDLPETADQWLDGAKEHKGSWWPDWEKWLRRKSGGKIPALDPETGPLTPIEDAPGSYVKLLANI